MAKAFKEPTVELTVNQNYLRRIDGRLNGLRVYDSGSAEIVRIEAARLDVLSHMSEDEIAQYNSTRKMVLTPQEIAAKNEAERLAMEENRDSQSI